MGRRVASLAGLPGGAYRGDMLGSDYSGQNCSVARTLEAVGERWTLLIVRELLHRPSRFSEIERRLSVAKNILSDRLDKLTRLQIVVTTPYKGTQDWKVYQLTEKGYDLFPVISALMAWGDAHDAPCGAPAVLRHTCGHPAGHRVVCEACGEPLDAHAVQLTAGPGWITPDAGTP